MSKYDLPELPSDDELGITDEDREAYAKEHGDDRPELSDAEMRALLGDTPRRAAAGPEKSKTDRGAARKAEKTRKRAEKERRKAEKAARKAEAAAKKADRKREERAAAAGRGPGPDEEGDQQRRLEAIRAAGAAGGAGVKPTDGGEPPGGPKQAPPTGGARPRSRWRGPVTLAVLLAVGVVASSRTGLPRPLPANAPDTAFSASRAMATLIEIAARAHPPGSPEHARVRSLLVDRLSALGLEPEVQTTTTLVEDSSRARAATVRNVVARVEGTDPTGAVLLTAHYDGRGISRAAGDDGSGVVTVLEAIRAVLAGDPPRNDLIVLLTDAEELGLLGARAFVQEHPWMADVSVVLSFEMRGSAGPSIMFETNERNGWIVRALDAFDPAPVANSAASEVYRRMPPDTDFTPFKDAGKQGLNFAAIGNGHVYHQAYDTPDRLSEATLQHHGVHALAAARYLGSADLADVDAPDVVYFTVPLLGLVVYPASLVLPISGLLLLLMAGAFLAARRGGARPVRIAVGTAVAVATGAVVYAGAYVFVGWLDRFHPEAGSLDGSLFHSEGWYVLALLGLSFTAVTGAYTLSRRWLRPTDLALGALVLPTLGAIVVGFVAPLAAMNLQLPVAAALLAVTLTLLLGARADRAVGWITATLLAAPVLAILVMVVELVWLALTLATGAWLALAMVVALHLCLPALEALRHPNGWWAPLTGATTVVVGVGAGLLMSRPGEDRPLPTTLVYAYEHGTGAALWATDSGADSLDAEAIDWAVTRAGGAFDATRDLAGFLHPDRRAPTAPAPVVSAQPPEVVISRDTIEGSTRRVTLDVRSRIGAEMLAFVPDERGAVRMLALEERRLTRPAGLARLEHWGEPEGPITLELEMPADQPIWLHVVEHLLRPEELLGASAFARPPRLAPDVTRLSDRAMLRYSVAAFVDPRHAVLPPGAAPADTADVPDSATTPPDTAASDTASVPPDTGAATDTATAADTGAAADTALATDTGSAADTAMATDTGAVIDTASAPVDTDALPADTGPAADTAARVDTVPVLAIAPSARRATGTGAVHGRPAIVRKRAP